MLDIKQPTPHTSLPFPSRPQKLDTRDGDLGSQRHAQYSADTDRLGDYDQDHDEGGARASHIFNHELARPYKVQKPVEAGDFGYTAPSEQTRYDGPNYF